MSKGVLAQERQHDHCELRIGGPYGFDGPAEIPPGDHKGRPCEIGGLVVGNAFMRSARS